MTTLLAFLFVFTLLVFVHELGHFLSARLMGVRVKEFAFGFPPRLFSKKYGKTNYIINLLPIGGYVQLLGEQGEDSSAKDSLTSKKPWQKAIIFGSGVFMNFLLAWFVLTLFYGFGGQAIIGGMWDHKGVVNTQKVLVTEVKEGTPAEEAGVIKGDYILSVGGKSAYAPETVIMAVQGTKEPINMVFERDGQKTEKTISAKEEKISIEGQEVTVKQVGLGLDTAGKISAPWHLAPIVAAQETYRITKLTVVEFGKFLGTAISTGKLSENVGGPIAIVKITGVAASLGFAALLQVLIMLSVSLGVLNILPFPALDGGHILFLAIEKVLGKEIPQNLKDTINKLGFGLLLLLVAWITFKDFGRFGIFN